jgi:hypothetical protein
MQNPKIVHLLLRVSLASVFLYAAVASTLQPEAWIWYMPAFLRDIFPASLLLGGFSLYQVVLSLWLLSGWRTFVPALLSALTMLAIIIFNYQVMDVVFRDFAIFFTSIALAAGSYKKASQKK